MDDLLISLCLENFFRTQGIFSYYSSEEHILTLITSLIAQLLIDLLLYCLLQEAALLISPLSNDLHGGTRSLWFLCRCMNILVMSACPHCNCDSSKHQITMVVRPTVSGRNSLAMSGRTSI